MGTALIQVDKIYYELLNGQPMAMASGTANHSNVAVNIISLFKNYLRGKFCRVYAELDVHLSDNDRFRPDVMVVCKQDIIKKNGVHGAPDLVVEVLSPSTIKRDRGYKMQLYAKSGVKELWLVDSENRTIETYLLQNEIYELDNGYALLPDYILEKMSDEDKAEIIHEFNPSIFKDMVIRVEDVFEGLLGDFN